MDNDLVISLWILEFLVRKGIDDNLVKQFVSILPLPENKTPRWTKTMLLRTIYSKVLEGRISESILDLLEMIAEVDKKEDLAISDAMKSAYCEVALDCTMKFIKKNGKCSSKYLDAVERIWKVRIENLEKSENVDLISNQLRSSMKETESAISNKEVCKKLKMKNTRYGALKAVKVYVTEAWKVMGPTFLELVAKKMGDSIESQNVPFMNMKVSNGFNIRDENQANERTATFPNAHLKVGVREDCSMKDETISKNHVAHIVNSRANVGVADEPSRIDESIGRDEGQELEMAAMTLWSLALLDQEAGNGNVVLKRDLAANSGEHSRREIEMTDVEELPIDTSSKKVDSVPTSEALKLKEASKTRSVLKVRANDPVGSESNHMNNGQACENIVFGLNSRNQNDDVSPSLTKEDETMITMELEGNEDSPVNQNGNVRPSLTERSESAQNRTNEWVDSIYNNSPERCRSTGLDLPGRKKRKASSPLKKSKSAKVFRVRKRWSKIEEDTLRTGVERFGCGKWKLILTSYQDFFDNRTEVDLKDKWRNLMKY